MGVDLQKKPPVQRPPTKPITFFCDASYRGGDDRDEMGRRSWESLRSMIPAIVTARLIPGQDAPQTASCVTIMADGPGSASVWIQQGETRCFAEVIGPAAEQSAIACRAGRTGFVGPIISAGRNGNEDLWVRIDGI